MINKERRIKISLAAEVAEKSVAFRAMGRDISPQDAYFSGFHDGAEWQYRESKKEIEALYAMLEMIKQSYDTTDLDKRLNLEIRIHVGVEALLLKREQDKEQ